MTQTQSLHVQLKALESLQEIDLKIDSLKKNKSGLPAQLKALDTQVVTLQTQVDVKRKALEDLEKAQRQGAGAMELSKDRLARSQGRIEQVQNSHEYQAVNKEIEQLRKALVNLEEQGKKQAIDIDAARKDLETVETQANELKNSREGRLKDLQGESSKLGGDVDALSADRMQYTTVVEKRILALYDRVRAGRAGLGIAPAAGGRCKACNMVVPPQLYIQVQKALEIHSCPSCARILYVPESLKS